MKLEFFDAGDFATDGRHRISLRESRRRLNTKSNTISRLRKRMVGKRKRKEANDER